MKVSEFESILGQLTVHDLYQLHSQLYSQFETAPVWDTGATKPAQVRNFTYWVKDHPGNLNTIITMTNQLIQKKEMAPVRGPVPGTRYILWSDLEKMKSYPDLAEAINFHQYGSSKTKDGYISVHAIYNMSAWENWKSSSLSGADRAKAEAVGKLNLLALMRLNEGRRKDQPALFPERMLN